MQLKEFDILIDIKKYNKTEYFEVVQGDNNSNILNISLVDGLKKFNLTNTDVEIIFNKSDGTTVQQTDISVINEAEGRIQCVLKTNTIAAPGKVIAEVRILQDETLLTSTTFEFWVRKSLLNEKTIESTNEFPILEKLAEDAQVIFDTEADRVAAEGIRVDNEGARIVDEDARVQAEGDRSVNETERISNEDTRTSNEITRIEDENLRASAELLRIDADAIREVNEQARNNAEVIRNNDEGIRQTNESDRIDAEKIRITAESNRTTMELSRVTAESGRVAAEQDRNDAESARTLAEQARDANYTQKINDFVAETERIESIYPIRLTNVENELTELSYITQRYTIDSWKKVQDIVRAGLADKAFRIGDQLVAQYNGNPVIWDVIGINHDTPTDKTKPYSLTIQAHDCIMNAQFDAPEPTNPDSNRQQYGNNRYIHSGIRQWLNSDAAAFTWVSQHEYDAVSSLTGPGFLKLLDPELAAVIGAVNKQVAKATVDGGGQDLFSDKVFLLSIVEVYGGTEGTVDGEKPYAFYENMAASPTTDPMAGRIKLLNGTARTWWLRSPNVGSSYYPRLVYPSGYVYNGSAVNALGLAPACCII